MSQSFPFVSRIPGNNVKTPNNHGFSLATPQNEKTTGINGTKPREEPKRKVIVVGAGIAGLRAASVLYRHGVEVVVLEGRDRIGGRIWTVRGNASGNSRVVRDMGAAWLHETARSPLNKLIPELGLTYYYDDGTPVYYTMYGRTGAQFKAEKAAEEYVHYAEWYYERNPQAKDRSVDSFIKQFVDQHKLMSRDEKLWAPKAVKNCEHMLGTTTAEASAKHLYYFAVPRDLYMKEGYDSITEWTAKAFKSDGETLQLNRVVEHIDWNENGPVRVRYREVNNRDADTMVADAVVVTAPLGSLHHHLISFSPSLPNDIAHGISKFSYGALGKVFFEFSEIFWSKENDQFIYYPPPAEIQGDEEDSSTISRSSPETDNILNYATTTINLSLVTENSKELCVQIVEPLTQRIEAMSHRVDEIYKFFLPLFKLLRTETYKPLPRLVNIAVTNWTQDPLAGFGTFSTEKVGDEPAILLEALANHSASRLQFAGDHCADVGSGCAHGAFSSGEVAATNLLGSFGIPYDGGDLVTVKCDVESD